MKIQVSKDGTKAVDFSEAIAEKEVVISKDEILAMKAAIESEIAVIEAVLASSKQRLADVVSVCETLNYN